MTADSASTPSQPNPSPHHHPAQSGWRAHLPGLLTAGPSGALAAAWGKRWVGAAVTAGAAASAALALSLAMPRGPNTTGDALTVMVVGLLVGLTAGFALRSRWAMLLAPTVYAAVFELAWLGESGPTVDEIRLGSTYGIIAFVTGRGLHSVLALVPMLLGASFGAAVARRWLAPSSERPTRGRRIGLYARRGVAGVVSAAMVILGVFIAQPANTDAIHGPDGQMLPGSVAELTTVPIGGHDQAVMIRGHSTDSPVLLFLAGGPGGTEIGSMRKLGAGLEEDFVVATWEQRGAGKSLGALEPVSTLTLPRVVSDTIEVTDYLRQRFEEQKVYLVGNSWGTIVGVLAAQQHPELFHAFVGTGQMVSPVETDRMFYADTLAWAERTGDTGLADELRRNGAPPYDELWKYEPALSHEHDWNDYPMVDGFQEDGEMPGNLLVEEYSLMEKLRALGGFLDTFSVLYPQLDDIDFRRDVTALQVPVYLLQGRHEARGRAGLAMEWFAALSAPRKQLVVFDRSGHKPIFEEPDRFRTVMMQTVLASTYPDRRP